MLQLVAEGRSTKEIASVLGIGVRTPESHRCRTTPRLDIQETAGFVRFAIRQGTISA